MSNWVISCNIEITVFQYLSAAAGGRGGEQLSPISITNSDLYLAELATVKKKLG
jgi:hypothetical protein